MEYVQQRVLQVVEKLLMGHWKETDDAVGGGVKLVVHDFFTSSTSTSTSTSTASDICDEKEEEKDVFERAYGMFLTEKAKKTVVWERLEGEEEGRAEKKRMKMEIKNK